MSKLLITDTKITNIADAIRTKTGAASGTTYTLDQMATAIGNIQTGISLTANDEGKVVSNGALVAQTARSSDITQNGTYDTTLNDEVVVNVPSASSASEDILPDVPNAYQIVQWLESNNGAAYVQVPYEASSGDTTEFEVTFTDRNASASEHALMGQYREYTSPTNGLNTFELYVSNGSLHKWLDGNRDSTIGNVQTDVEQTHEGSVRAGLRFIRYGHYRHNNYLGTFKLGELKMSTVSSSTDEIIAEIDLIPCYRKSDDAAGFYDIINGVFYENLGSSDFIVGPDVIVSKELVGPTPPSILIKANDNDYYYEYADHSHDFVYDYTGSIETFTAPASGSYKLEVYGGRGGNAQNNANGSPLNLGGLGGYSVGEISLSKGDILFIVVGGKGADNIATATSMAGGYNGGGSSYCDEARATRASGGGASHIALATGLLSELEDNKNSILIVAGGGGGASSFSNIVGQGGSGGGTTGGDGTGSDGTPGTGGTQGTAGTGRETGAFGQGGSVLSKGSTYGGAGGGGGYYGGGAAGNNYSAGGGSGYISPSLSNASMTSGVNNGDGMIVITPDPSLNLPDTTYRVIKNIYKMVNGVWTLEV